MQLAADLSLSSRGRSSGAPAAPWTPLSLGADLLGYWDAETLASLTLSTANVVTWTDRVAGCAPTQASASLQPLYSATSFNGRPGVTFDGTDDTLIVASIPAGFPVGSTGGEIWALASQDYAGAQAGNQTMLSYGDTANLNCRRLYRINASNVSRAGVTATGSATDTLVDLTGIHVARATFAAAVIGVSADGNTATTASVVPATASSGAVAIGSLTNGTNRFWKGAINAILVTNPLSAGQSASLLAFLKARGGIP